MVNVIRRNSGAFAAGSISAADELRHLGFERLVRAPLPFRHSEAVPCLALSIAAGAPR